MGKFERLKNFFRILKRTKRKKKDTKKYDLGKILQIWDLLSLELRQSPLNVTRCPFEINNNNNNNNNDNNDNNNNRIMIIRAIIISPVSRQLLIP